MHTTTLSFRAGDDFVEETRKSATLAGLKSSDYIREAVREKNERMMAERIAMLSRQLSAKHLAFNESVEDTLADGLES
ncbi:antitoxin of toxin-antitoxin stability system [Burkholderia guangdongensis]|uniref:antitoxin of toxin-antitoxin stability system n=1 Tax=Burkholderia guangdongensis TaxID=1792500 RepID=UPI0015CB3121